MGRYTLGSDSRGWSGSHSGSIVRPGAVLPKSIYMTTKNNYSHVQCIYNTQELQLIYFPVLHLLPWLSGGG